MDWEKIVTKADDFAVKLKTTFHNSDVDYGNSGLAFFDLSSLTGPVKRAASNIIKKLKIKDLKNVRNCGLIMAFDFENAETCNEYSDKMFDRGMLFNKTGDKTIRFRPSLALSKEELEESLKIIFSI